MRLISLWRLLRALWDRKERIMRPSDQSEPPVFAEITLSSERSRLLRLCTQLTGSSEAAEDLAQHTLYEARPPRAPVRHPPGQAPWPKANRRHRVPPRSARSFRA